MTHKTPTIRPAMTAIAAVMALSAPSFAQSVDPAVATPAPPVEVVPVPVAAEPLAAEPIVIDTAAEPVAAEPAAKPTARKATTAKAAIPRPVAARTADTAPVVASTAPVAEVPIAPPLPIEPLAAAPIAEPAAAPAAAADASTIDLLRTAALGGLGLLALTGAGLVVRRRRRRAAEAEEAEWQAKQAAVAAAEPVVEAPAPIDPIFAKQPTAARPAKPAPAFVLGAAPAAASVSAGDCIDPAPGSHVEAACDGPSETNPSLSIKKRIKRARFFDEREQLAAAGLAVPVEADAGLPDSVEMPEPATAQGTREPA